LRSQHPQQRKYALALRPTSATKIGTGRRRRAF
jgi:hypothetical protein